MSRFRQLFSRTGAPLLVQQFGETITYYADGGDSGREITARVERNVDAPGETGQAGPSLIVTVLDSVTAGILATEIDSGGDEVSVALKAGGTAERRQITRVIDDSNGLVRFQVR